FGGELSKSSLDDSLATNFWGTKENLDEGRWFAKAGSEKNKQVVIKMTFFLFIGVVSLPLDF
ncbi:hypothetical protein IEC73_004854, partial [Salmonella enterica]|nr:hypothetical protein [Salmonella enterica]